MTPAKDGRNSGLAALYIILLAVLLSGLVGCGSPQEDSRRERMNDVEQVEVQNEVIASLQDSLRHQRRVIEIANRYDVSPKLSRAVVDAADRWQLDLEMFARLVQTESGWRPRAIGGVGEVGLTQIKPSTAGIPRDSLLDPRVNAMAGARYLSKLLARYPGDLHRALRAYNAGPSRVATNDRVSQDYAREVRGL